MSHVRNIDPVVGPLGFAFASLLIAALAVVIVRAGFIAKRIRFKSGREVTGPRAMAWATAILVFLATALVLAFRGLVP